MAAETVLNIEWYSDKKAVENGDPGMCHSYIGSLATVFNYRNGDLDPAWLMGVSGFAFRININEVFCPSAFSIFSFDKVLPEAVEQMGYQCEYISRLWDQTDREEEKRAEAHDKIVGWINNGVPAVSWDVAEVEWGLVTGYDDKKELYTTLTCKGEMSTLPYNRLGRNGIDILAVNIPGKKNNRSRDEIILNSLKTVVDHAEQREWTERPQYQNGFAGYDLWALNFEKWKILLDAGKGPNLPKELPAFSKFYAGMYYGARFYAGEYLEAISNNDSMLKQASVAYKETAAHLKPLWDFFKNSGFPDGANCGNFAECIRKARRSEEIGVEYIKEHIFSRESK